MTNLELIAALAKRLNWTQRQTTEMLEVTVAVIGESLQAEDSVNISGLGLFEAKKKGERISVNPTTKQRFLVPPKIVVAFKPTQIVKDRLKKITVNE